MKPRLTHAWLALIALVRQLLLWIDQGGNVLLPGVWSVLVAILTGRRQDTAFADETLSAHAWRAYDNGAHWGRICLPIIDLLFLWQEEDEEVNERAGRRITGHCERAFWKELLRREMPIAYRQLQERSKA